MSALPGNPYADELKLHQDFGNTLTPTVQATLALAFEQRTRALIELAGFYVNDGHREHGLPVLKEINARLGMTEEP